MQKIMIVEDDPVIREELALLLENEGYQALPLQHFTDVPGEVLREKPELILLDLGLPGLDGFSLCAQIRKSTGTPIIFVTSRDSAMDEIRGLSLGADDYIAKPYSIPVLLARVKTVLRRGGGESDRLEAKGLVLQLSRGSVSYQGREAELSRNELRILAKLMQNTGRIVSRTELIEALWDNQIYIDDNSLSVNITRLRGKLEGLGLTDCIKTRRGMGYQL